MSSPNSSITTSGGGGGGGATAITAQKPLRLRRVNHSDEVLSGFMKLLKTETMSDVTLICSGGQMIRAHKVILSMFSPYFRAIFEAQPFANNPNHYPVIVIKDLTYFELRVIIDFIYKGEASVPRDKLNSIVQAAKALEISGLSDIKDSPANIAASVITGNGGGLASNLSSPGSSNESTGNGGASSINNGNNSTISSTSNFGSISGALSGVGALGGNTLSVSGTGYKRGQQDLDSASTGTATIFGGTGPDPQLKKLRITLDSGGDLNNSLIDLSTGFNVNTLTNAANILLNDTNIDGVRSLLQQPSRLPSAFQQMRQQQQQLHQLQLQQRQQAQRQQISLQQYMQQKQLQQKQQQLQQKQLQLQQQMKQHLLQQQLMQRSASKLSNLKGTQSTQFAQFQQRIKAQFPRLSSFTQSSSALQNRLLQSKNVPAALKLDTKSDQKLNESDKDQQLQTTTSSSNVTDAKAANSTLNATSTTSSLSSTSSISSSSSKDDNKCSNDKKSATTTNENNDNEVTSALETGSALNESHDTSKEDEDDANENGGVGGGEKTKTKKDNSDDDDNDEQQPDQEGSSSPRNGKMDGKELKVDEDEMDEESENHNRSGEEGVEYLEDEEEEVITTIQAGDEDEEYEVEIDKDLIFQRQQQLRLQQLQKQQQFQQQWQLQQEEQEQKLMEFHQQLQQVSEQAAVAAAAAAAVNTGNEDTEESGTGFGFNWQEGFIDDGFPTSNDSQDPQIIITQPSPTINAAPPPPQTPDFLQPRGPGRPRKGNKSTEISPCPECNKVFVRPDVLKLHYRSVHLNERHPCNLCPKIFKWPGDLSKHKRTKHPDAV